MNKVLYSVGFMFMVSLFFISLVSMVKLSSEERIERNQKLKLQKTVLNVLGIPLKETSSSKEIFKLFEKRVKTITFRNRDFYIGYETDGTTIKGYAFQASGPGFWGPIYCMVAVDPDASQIIGVVFYRHSETPGLGGRISEPWFAKQFVGLPLHPIEGKKQIFYLTPSGEGKAGNELDAITGATRTSSAVELFLNRELDLFIREFWNHIRKESLG